jgi:cellobiose transport system permease protein
MMVPFQTRLIPSFILIRSSGWLNTFWALIVPGAAEAFGIFLLRQYMKGAIADELLDAGNIDGRPKFQIYHKVALPVVVPALVMLGLMTAKRR